MAKKLLSTPASANRNSLPVISEESQAIADILAGMIGQTVQIKWGPKDKSMKVDESRKRADHG